MLGGISGQRYAKAIFELGLERDRLDEWASDLEFVDAVLQDAEFRTLLMHAEVPVGDKIKAIDAVLSETEPLIRNMFNLLVKKGLLDTMSDLRAAYADLLDEHHGRQRARVTSAVPLEQGELDRITDFVSKLVRKEVVLSADVDGSILGGLVMQIGDRLMDGSTRSQLVALRNSMRSGGRLT